METDYGFDFAKDVHINRFKLADECEQHASLYQFYSYLLADAKTKVDKAKDKVGMIEAGQELSIRKDPPEHIAKITDAVVKALVQSDSGVLEAKDNLSEAKQELYPLESAVTALEHRKRMLDNLVQLLISGYYSAPKTERQQSNPANDKASKDARKNLNKNKKT